MRRSVRGDRIRRRSEARARLLAEDLRRDYLRALDTLAAQVTPERIMAGADVLTAEEIVRAFAPWRRTLRDGVENAGARTV